MWPLVFPAVSLLAVVLLYVVNRARGTCAHCWRAPRPDLCWGQGCCSQWGSGTVCQSWNGVSPEGRVLTCAVARPEAGVPHFLSPECLTYAASSAHVSALCR